MSTSSYKLYYRKNNATYSCNLYTTTAEVGAEWITVYAGGQKLYAPLKEVADGNSSDLRVVKNNLVHIIQKTAKVIPVPGNSSSLSYNSGYCTTGKYLNLIGGVNGSGNCAWQIRMDMSTGGGWGVNDYPVAVTTPELGALNDGGLIGTHGGPTQDKVTHKLPTGTFTWGTLGSGHPVGRINGARQLGSTYYNGNDYLVSYGGDDGIQAYGDIYVMNGQSGTWTKTTGNSARVYHSIVGVTAAYSPNYIMGGASDFAGNTVVNTNLRYYSLMDQWATLTAMPGNNKNHCAVYSPVGNCIYVAGGHDGTNARNVLWRYNIDTNDWTTLATMPAARHKGALGYYDEVLFFAGGLDNAGTRMTNTMTYDIAANTWQAN